MNVRYIVELTDAERAELVALTHKGRSSARQVLRANILLMADGRAHTDEEISRALSTGTSTVFRTKRRLVEGGVEHALTEARRPGGRRKLDVNQESILIATACSKPPGGRATWTMQLLSERLIAMGVVDCISAETVRRRLKENALKPWQQKMWCVPEVDADYIANMEDVLDVYARPRDENKPLVCFDETFKQLVGDVRSSLPPKPGKAARVDYEYRRNGTANLFMFVAPFEGWRHVKVTERKGNVDFAECMRDLVDAHFPEAEVIRVVLDNLGTHRPGALYKAFSAAEARRILRRLEFHYTPKHGSWLNMAEIEIGILSRQCLDQRIPDDESLRRHVAAWEDQRNAAREGINWMFGIETARTKLTKAYARVRSDRAPEASSLAA